MPDQQETTQGVFVIDGEECPFPDFGQGFDMAEAMVFFDYTGFPIEDLIVETDDLDEEALDEYQMKIRNPKTLAALMHMAYQRRHPNAKESNVRKLIRSTDFAEALKQLVEASDAGPPEPSSTASSNGSSEVSSSTSGTDSTTSSEPPDATPASIGTGESGTSSPEPTGATAEPYGQPI